MKFEKAVEKELISKFFPTSSETIKYLYVGE